MTTGYDSPKMLIISHLVSLGAVPVNASTGTEGDKLICKDTSLGRCRCPSPWLFKKLGTK